MQASGRALRDFGGWLPAPLAQEIARRELAAEHPPEPEKPAEPSAPPGAAFTMSKPQDTAIPAPHAATYIPTQAATPQAPQAHAAYAPTQAAPAPAHGAPHVAAQGQQPWPYAPQTPQPRSGPKPGVVIGALAAGLLVVAGGGWAVADGLGWLGADRGAGEPSEEAATQYERVVEANTVTFGTGGTAEEPLNLALDLDKDIPVRDQASRIGEFTTSANRLTLYYGDFGKAEGATPAQC
ncbi:hypothetical protein [Streptomyces sp. ISL-98]|uniref:hypothetical protein n=1 Tax=Streptomyces sp. ISL-98 TaxID=2819192 RepID=UPI0027E44D72|nr:hypothetical protein [Streptomyces sp. ISL-98]